MYEYEYEYFIVCIYVECESRPSGALGPIYRSEGQPFILAPDYVTFPKTNIDKPNTDPVENWPQGTPPQAWHNTWGMREQEIANLGFHSDWSGGDLTCFM